MLFAEEEIAYYRDVYDHAVRVIDQVDAVRDLVSSALEIHLSVVANRQNEISKQLTLIATIFLPLTFLTGFFGQNFGYMVNRIAGGAAFWGLGIGSEVLALVGLVIFFKVKKWF
jgi:magnesium transporter